MTPVVRLLLAANFAAFMLQAAFPIVDYFGVFVPRLVLVHGGLRHVRELRER